MSGEEGLAAMTLTLADLRYLLRLVRVDYWECRDWGTGRSIRVERKLVGMIGEMKGGDQVAAKQSKAAPKKSAAKPSKPKGKAKKK